MKVFCCYCKNLDISRSTKKEPTWICNAPGNIQPNWFLPEAGRELKPEQRNLKNNCKLFSPGENSFTQSEENTGLVQIPIIES